MIDERKKKAKAANAAWHRAHPDYSKTVSAEWRKDNPEKVKAAYQAHKKAKPTYASMAAMRWAKANPEKSKAATARWVAANPEKVKAASARWNKAHKEREAGRPRPDACEVCGCLGRICFDHCHISGVFRGWLCNGCNAALGHVKDNPETLIRLARYVKVHTAPKNKLAA